MVMDYRYKQSVSFKLLDAVDIKLCYSDIKRSKGDKFVIEYHENLIQSQG